MKWKRSRKAQQESKNKDNHSSNNEDKQSRSDRSSSNQSTAYKNGNSEKASSNSSSNNFHFSKNMDPNTHIPPHPAVLHQRHLNSLQGSSKDLVSNNVDENYATNLINRQQQSVFNEPDLQEIWRVV